ncbi:MAG: hypothetical protein V2I82_14455 [Halieaceae bacterium]|jgi:hypothetical protein|nr:hypothetical protein [Halieaceae bacterium]
MHTLSTGDGSEGAQAATSGAGSEARTEAQQIRQRLARGRADWEYERRFNTVGLLVLLSAMPLLAYVALTYHLQGAFSAPALVIALLAFMILVFVASTVARRAITAALQAEGQAPEGYRPPNW